MLLLYGRFIRVFCSRFCARHTQTTLYYYYYYIIVIIITALRYASAVYAVVRVSVCPSVSHTPVLYQNG